MTELEQARELLHENQGTLAEERRALGQGYSDPIRVRYWERCVLAALSWVWDAQGRREGLNGPFVISAGLLDPTIAELIKGYSLKVLDRDLEQMIREVERV